MIHWFKLKLKVIKAELTFFLFIVILVHAFITSDEEYNTFLTGCSDFRSHFHNLYVYG